MSELELVTLRDATARQRGHVLLSSPEDQWFDRKSGRVRPRDLANVMVGLANAEGGMIAVGLHDGGLDGPIDVTAENALRQAAVDFTVPPVRAHVERMDVELAEEAASVLLVQVDASDRVHTNVKDEAYLRVGDETRRLSFDQRRERGTGRRQQVTDDRRIEGPLAQQIAGARAAIAELVPTRRALGPGGVFTDVPSVPPDAWMEGLVNAVTHRSYSVIGDHIRVEVFDDRLEISSPGRFPGVVDLDRPERITRFARNPRIARVLADLGFGQELGEGIRRMFEEMRLAGLAEPEYVQTSGSVTLVLPADPVDRDLEARLSQEARVLVRAIRDAGRISTGELVRVAGRSRPSVLRDLDLLRQAGVVDWVGNSKKDPRAYWRLPTGGSTTRAQERTLNSG